MARQAAKMAPWAAHALAALPDIARREAVPRPRMRAPSFSGARSEMVSLAFGYALSSCVGSLGADSRVSDFRGISPIFRSIDVSFLWLWCEVYHAAFATLQRVCSLQWKTPNGRNKSCAVSIRPEWKKRRTWRPHQ
jgi:hypothetical protein